MPKILNLFAKLISSVKYSVQKPKNEKNNEISVVGVSIKMVHFDSNISCSERRPILTPNNNPYSLYPKIDACSLFSPSVLGSSCFDYTDESFEGMRNLEISSIEFDANLSTDSNKNLYGNIEEFRNIKLSLSPVQSDDDISLLSYQSECCLPLEELNLDKVKWMFTSPSMFTLNSIYEVVELVNEDLKVYMDLDDEIICEHCCS